MSVPFILLLVGILTVVGGIIRFKLHAFLALLLPHCGRSLHPEGIIG